jgi:hypothetical protein
MPGLPFIALGMFISSGFDSVLLPGSVQVDFSAQVGNRTCVHGGDSGEDIRPNAFGFECLNGIQCCLFLFGNERAPLESRKTLSLH